MGLSRDVILDVLRQYLDGDIDKEKVYSWALEVAVSRDYQDFSGEDPLGAKVVHALIDINHDDVKSIPTERALEYYRQCLSGEKDYVPLSEIDLKSFGRPVKERREPGQKMSFRSRLRWLVRKATIAFGLGVFVVFLIMFFVKGGPWAENRLKVFLTIVPLIFYGGVLVLPPGIVCKKKVFSFVFPLLVIGTAYFGSFVGQRVFGLSLPIMHKIGVLLALLIIPLSAIVLAIKEKQWYVNHV